MIVNTCQFADFLLLQVLQAQGSLAHRSTSAVVLVVLTGGDPNLPPCLWTTMDGRDLVVVVAFAAEVGFFTGTLGDGGDPVVLLFLEGLSTFLLLVVVRPP